MKEYYYTLCSSIVHMNNNKKAYIRYIPDYILNGESEKTSTEWKHIVNRLNYEIFNRIQLTEISSSLGDYLSLNICRKKVCDFKIDGKGFMK